MEWQPIETAPKDGRNVILCEIVDGEYSQYPETFSFRGGKWISAIDGSSLTVAHNYWMPLPAPPKEGVE